jgi:hypothetical protein
MSAAARSYLRTIAAIGALLALSAGIGAIKAHAQAPTVASVVATCGTPNSASQYAAGSTAPITVNTAGVLCQTGTGGGAASNVTLVPPTGTPNETTVTCGVTTTTLLAAASATNFILVKVPSGGGTVWVNAAGVAAVAAPPSIDIVGGGTLLWSPVQGFVPSSALNCIAAVAQAVTLVWK